MLLLGVVMLTLNIVGCSGVSSALSSARWMR